LASALRDAAPDCVLHFAGTASVAGSFAGPLGDFESSTVLWFRLLEAARALTQPPLVALASSAAVYGSPRQLPTPETAERRPESPYGFHKAMSELAGEEFARCFGVPVISLRYFSIFGPNQRRLLAWEIFDQLRRGAAELRLKGTGDEQRDFLAEEEAAAATVALVEALAADRPTPAFHAVNVASGTGVTVGHVAETIRASLASDAHLAFGGEALPGNPLRWQADISALRKWLPAWEPQPFAKSLANCVAAWNGDGLAEANQ
jgi:UDP-glucose 4-epimerase